MLKHHRAASWIKRSSWAGDQGLIELEPRICLSGVEYSETGVPLTWTNSTAPMMLPGGPSVQGEDDGPSPWLSLGENQINLDDFRLDRRFGSLTGAGYAAVIIDSGIDRNHPFFGVDTNRNGVADRIVYSYDFADNDSDASDYDDHGSNVSSIIGSSDFQNPGIAPGVNLIHLKVFSDTGENILHTPSGRCDGL